MQQNGEQIRTDIADEQAVSPAKGKKRIWLFVGLGTALLAVATAILLMAVWRHKVRPGPTEADQEQQKYDAGQKEQERQKAA
ncbi:MAG TPA: hypothetical protein VE398_13815 [Acidobacteriota bacterium]|nr:hypothetical protein [Acidobacteriota bacterium]